MAQHIANRAIYTQCVEALPCRGSATNISRYWKQHWTQDPATDDEDSEYNPQEEDSWREDEEEEEDDDDIDDDNPSSSSSSTTTTDSGM